MNSVTFHIVTQNQKFELKIESDEDLCFFSAVNEFVIIFSYFENKSFYFSPIQIVTDELKLEVKEFINNYKDRFPNLNKFNKKISDLSNGEKFLITTDLPTKTEDILDMELFLEAINNETNEEKIKSYFQNKKNNISPLSEQIKNYHLFIPRNDIRIVIGNKLKEKRVCRFCNGITKNNSQFNKIAHAIPEALGNKNIILADECDSCNEFFGDNIEPHLIEYLNFHRVSIGIKGKEGYPKIKYKNGMAHHDGEKVIVMSRDIIDDGNGNLEIELLSNNKFISVNFYKALCKMALSVIDESELEYLTKTIEWVRYNKIFNLELPCVGVSVNNNFYTPVPEILVLTKNNNLTQSPHVVCQFGLGSYLYVFILPFSDKDTLDFNDDNQMKVFFDMFPQFSSERGWSYIKFDSQEKIELKIKIKLENKQNNDN